MTFYGEYTTLDDLRKSGEGAQLTISSNAADPFLLELIREVSDTINGITGRKFAPYIDTQHYDAVGRGAWSMGQPYYSGGRLGEFQSRSGGYGYGYGRVLKIDSDDLLAVTTLTNGDDSTIAAADFLLYPANTYPKNEIRLKPSSGVTWLPDSDGNYEQVIDVLGIFGYHSDYTGTAWGGGGTIADAGGISAVVTTMTASSGAGIKAGHLLKIETEYLYVSAVAGTAITVVRGVNGSTAAAHDTATAVSYWRPEWTVAKICRMAVASHWNLRANPEGKQVSVNGVTFTTPHSVAKWMEDELGFSGLSKVSFA